MKLLIRSSLLLACVASSLGLSSSVPTKTKSIVPYPAKVAEERDGAGHGGHGGGGGIGGYSGGGGGHGGGGLGGHGGGHGGGLGGGIGGGIGGGYGGGGGGGIGGGSYAEEPAKDTGYYYYYYPVVPDTGGKKKGGLFSGSKGFFGKMMETIMYPIMYPFMRMYDYFDGRALTARASDYLPMPVFEKVAKMVEEEMYKEECLERMICQLGKLAEGYDTFVQLSDYFVPEEYQTHLKTFKESAQKKTDCVLTYKCISLDPPQKYVASIKHNSKNKIVE